MSSQGEAAGAPETSTAAAAAAEKAHAWAGCGGLEMGHVKEHFIGSESTPNINKGKEAHWLKEP